MQILDVGGGFEDDNFEDMAYSLREAITHEFMTPITLIAEPGRFYASGFYTMACQVIARRIQQGVTSKLPDMLYLNDGLYGCFSSKWTEGRDFTPTLIESRGGSGAPRDWKPRRYSIWGPTCDSMDCISKDSIMNQEIIVGDWLRFEDMGGKSHYHIFTTHVHSIRCGSAWHRAQYQLTTRKTQLIQPLPPPLSMGFPIPTKSST